MVVLVHAWNPSLRKWRQDEQEFKASFGNTSHYLKKQTNKGGDREDNLVGDSLSLIPRAHILKNVNCDAIHLKSQGCRG